jgi:serine/threonine protein kinase
MHTRTHTQILSGLSAIHALDIHIYEHTHTCTHAHTQILSGLSAIHALGLPHGDLKPTNIIRKNCGSLIIVDIGASHKDVVSTLLSGASIPMGSSPYMAPEQLFPSDATPLAMSLAADVFSVGVIYYELVAGYLPFFPGKKRQEFSAESDVDIWADSDEIAQMLENVKKFVVHDAPDCLPLEWYELVKRSLHRDLDIRFK